MKWLMFFALLCFHSITKAGCGFESYSPNYPKLLIYCPYSDSMMSRFKKLGIRSIEIKDGSNAVTYQKINEKGQLISTVQRKTKGITKRTYETIKYGYDDLGRLVSCTYTTLWEELFDSIAYDNNNRIIYRLSIHREPDKRSNRTAVPKDKSYKFEFVTYELFYTSKVSDNYILRDSFIGTYYIVSPKNEIIASRCPKCNCRDSMSYRQVANSTVKEYWVDYKNSGYKLKKMDSLVVLCDGRIFETYNRYNTSFSYSLQSRKYYNVAKQPTIYEDYSKINLVNRYDNYGLLRKALNYSYSDNPVIYTYHYPDLDRPRY